MVRTGQAAKASRHGREAVCRQEVGNGMLGQPGLSHSNGYETGICKVACVLAQNEYTGIFLFSS